MDSYCEPDDLQTGHIKLKEGFDINVLLQGEGDTFEINLENIDEMNENIDNDEPLELSKDDKQTIIELTGTCMGFVSDEESDVDSTTPFEKLVLSMKKVTDDGKIMKKIKKNGIGETPEFNSLVSIKYSIYSEGLDDPVDAAHMAKPFQFRLGTALIYGLNIAVQTMKVNEIAWFLIHPDYAFGKMGCPPRISPNATFLFHIQLLCFVDSGPALLFDEVKSEDKKKFSYAQQIAKGLLESAKLHYQRNLKFAIREYNKAKTLLEDCVLSNIEEQEEQQKMLLKIYNNLALCYNKDNMHEKACTMCNNIYNMAKNTSIKIPAKVYFHNGRALFMIGDYRGAREKLLLAQEREPLNDEINKELAKVIQKYEEERARETKFARAFFQTGNPEKPVEEKEQPETDEDDTFRKAIREHCAELKGSTTKNSFTMPAGLSERECEIIKSEAKFAGLIYREIEINDKEDNKSGQIVYTISKV